MSRAPSSGTSAFKFRSNVGADGSTPVIVEEPNENSTPGSRPTSALSRTDPHHSRNVSSSSIPRSGLATPTSVTSPARSPKVEPQKSLPEPESASFSTFSPVSPIALLGSSPSLSAEYATREADIATALKTSSGADAPTLGAAEKESQAAFLESHHHAQSPIEESAPRSRSESPSKGRVHELAGKFGDVSHSRRGSTQSNMSVNSVQSWERSRENSRPSSPTKQASSSERPAATRDASFRPKLPGQWESYATTAPTSSHRGEQESYFEGSSAEAQRTSSPLPLGEVDLTPTTAKHPLVSNEPSKSSSDPLETLKAVGAAVGDAIQSSIVLYGDSNEPGDGTRPKQFVGDVHLDRPLHLERTASSIASSVPPTPPAKNTPEFEEMPPPPPLKPKSPEPTMSSSQQPALSRPVMLPQLSTDPSEHDEESDRLRKEIVARLSPPTVLNTSEAEQRRKSLQPNAATSTNRESSILPSEYESYWAGEPSSPGLSQGPGSRLSDDQSAVTARPNPENMPALTRFSWENASPGVGLQDDQALAGSEPKVTSDLPEALSASKPVAFQNVQDDQKSISFADFPDPYFGPAHASAATPQPISESEINTRAPTPPSDSNKPSASPDEGTTPTVTLPTSGQIGRAHV